MGRNAYDIFMIIAAPEDKRKFAILFACVAGVLFVVTMSVETYRIKFFCDSQVYYGRLHFVFLFADKNQGTIYQETERILSEHWFSVTYTDKDGNMIT